MCEVDEVCLEVERKVLEEVKVEDEVKKVVVGGVVLKKLFVKKLVFEKKEVVFKKLELLFEEQVVEDVCRVEDVK